MKAANPKSGKTGLIRSLLSFLGSATEPEPRPGEVKEPEPEERSGRRVLIVDDDAVVLKTTSHKLAAAGYEVVTAIDGSEAINAIGAAKPDLILLDLDFPPDVANGGRNGWDGFKLMSWLRGLRNTQGTRFIIITGSSDPVEAERRAMASGAAGFFQKPLDFRRLIALLDRELCPQAATTT
jgi:CheY-like chemotaxis protein